VFTGASEILEMRSDREHFSRPLFGIFICTCDVIPSIVSPESSRLYPINRTVWSQGSFFSRRISSVTRPTTILLRWGIRNLSFFLFCFDLCLTTRIGFKALLLHPHCRGFSIALRHTALGTTSLDDGSAHRRDFYLTAHNAHKIQTSMPRLDSTRYIQQPSGRRPTAWTARPLGSVYKNC